MKTTSATSNGPRLVHAAENTDDVKILALTPHHYRPDAVRRAARMERDPFGGYRIEIPPIGAAGTGSARYILLI